MKTKGLITSLLIFFNGMILTAQNKADDIIGVWLTAGDDPAKIQIYKNGDNFSGKIIWMKNPLKEGKQRLDSKNPEVAKRTNPVIGLLLIKDFKFNNKDEWKGGTIYDPANGKTYSCYLYLKDRNTLKVRGYIGISLLGRTETWTRSD